MRKESPIQKSPKRMKKEDERSTALGRLQEKSMEKMRSRPERWPITAFGNRNRSVASAFHCKKQCGDSGHPRERPRRRQSMVATKNSTRSAERTAQSEAVGPDPRP